MKTLKSPSPTFKETPPYRALALQLVKHEEPDRTFYLRSTMEGIGSFFSMRVKELYHTLAMTFSLESMDWSSFKKYIWPTITSGAALIIGNYFTQYLSEYQTGSPEYDFIFKFIFGAAILGYCVLNRITDKKFTSQVEWSLAVASEVMAITYMYSSVFKGTTLLLNDKVSDEYSLITSLGASAVIVPSGISYLAQKAQELLIRFQYNRGGQRSDTAIISSGLTSISNLYFQINHFIASELMASSRIFQLGLIAHNIRHADKIVKKFRNLPALLADLAPSTLKKMGTQQERIEQDYAYNHKLHQVLRFTTEGPIFFNVPRYKLRTGDFVYCDNSIDLTCVPVSGELVALKRDGKGNFTQVLEPKKFSVNLKAQNGEDVWIEHQTKPEFTSKYKKVDLHAVRDGKQAGVLVGDKLNLYANDNIFIQVKPEKELLLSSNYEKNAVINEIIAERKRRSVLYSILGSIIMAAFLQRDITQIPAETLRLMFTLFQTLIPFSEAFLRETVNSRLLKTLNNKLDEQPLEMIDALRVVDLCNALGGYYHDRFPNGVVIISDKTGTLTTTKMDVLGLWTIDMPPDVHQLLKEKERLLLPPEKQWLESFEVFCAAFTNNKKELEPEEHAILEFFTLLLNNQQCMEVTTYGNNHFKKVLTIAENKKALETFHLGLYRTFGGRFTLVREDMDYFLVFCGIPKPDAFKETPLLLAYNSMQNRTAVLSRDWCVARSKLSKEEFTILHELLNKDEKKEIELFILKTELLKKLSYHGTFIIDNPVKNGAEKFITHCREISVPVFVATGDTTKAAENIAKVLCPEYAKNILTVRANEVQENSVDVHEDSYPADSTVIFSGVNETILARFQKLMDKEHSKRPVIIFAEMTTEGKGILSRYLKNHHYFVVANGDGTNDVMMMKNSNMVIAHHSDDGTFAPGIDALSNISEEQLRKLFGSQKTFYELFDIHLPKSLFVQKFAPIANSQEKPTMALALKSGKMTFDLAKTVGANVNEMNQQHWYSVAFDLLWLWISFYEINESADLPMDNRNINASRLISNSMAIALFIAVMQSFANYALFNESTNFVSMLLMLSILPLVLKSIFSGFSMVQNTLYPAQEIIEEEEKNEVQPKQSILVYLGSFFSRKPTKQLDVVNSAPMLQ